MSQIDLKVTGMVCSGCSGTVQRVVTELAGVSSATVDHETGAASVEHDPAVVGIDAISQAITDAGFGISTSENPACKCDPCECDPCECGTSASENPACKCDPCECDPCECGTSASENPACKCDPCECDPCECGTSTCKSPACECENCNCDPCQCA